jgi:2-oxo-4-hydroxy-4-carboxy--5-ureidoimidazoline (OHCU) decarboxylase
MNNSDAQPSLAQAYETAGNPTNKSSREQSMAQLNSKTDSENAV